MADKSDKSDSSDSEKSDECSPRNDTSASKETSTSSANVFANDGSFLELFKKKLEEEKRRKQAAEQPSATTSTSCSSHASTVTNSVTLKFTKTSRLKEDNTQTSSSSTTGDSPKVEQKTQQEGEPVKKKRSLLSHVGKRPGGKLTLKTGQVKKSKQSEQESTPKDAWSKYMSEVEKYKAHVCSDDDKVRPLVK